MNFSATFIHRPIATSLLMAAIALFGAVIGILSTRNSGRNLCLIVAAIGAFRLFLGGGIF